MNSTKIINELTSIIAFADELKIKATGLRSELERFHAPAPKRGKKKVLSPEEEARLFEHRMKTILKNKKYTT